MTFAKFDELWILMSKYTFEVDSNAREEDFTCMICKKVMVDSYQSPCGCQYCHRCVLQYLGSESKCCLGDKEECKEENLLLDENVCRMPLLNRKISKLRVHCPNDSCSTIEELIKMEDHLRVCTKRAVECPYGVLGCDIKEGSKDKILIHINEDSFKHNKLLIDYIQNMKDEFSNFINYTKNYENMNQELKTLKEESIIKENEIEKLKKEVLSTKVDQEKDKLEIIFLKEESIIYKNAIEELTKETSDLKKYFEQNNLELKYLKDELMKEKESQSTEIKLLKESNGEKRKCEEERERKVNILIQSTLNLYPDIIKRILNVDFVWKNDEISKKLNKALYSESFTSNNYQLCLYLWVHSRDQGGSIGLGGVIMKGQKDDYLEWPMNKRLSVSLLDQDSFLAVGTNILRHDTYSNKRAFEQPGDEMNWAAYAWLSIDYITLRDRPSVLVQDSLVISGVLSLL